MMCRGLKEGQWTRRQTSEGKMVPEGKAMVELLFCAPKALGRLGKVYAGKSQDYIFIIKCSCGLQYAKWVEERKFPLSDKC